MYFLFICIRRRGGSAEGQRKWRKAWGKKLCVCLENNLNQQAGVDRNWIKPSGLPLKSMNSIFIMLECCNFKPLPPLQTEKKGEKLEWCCFSFFSRGHLQCDSSAYVLRWEGTCERRRDGQE